MLPRAISSMNQSIFMPNSRKVISKKCNKAEVWAEIQKLYARRTPVLCARLRSTAGIASASAADIGYTNLTKME